MFVDNSNNGYIRWNNNLHAHSPMIVLPRCAARNIRLTSILTFSKKRPHNFRTMSSTQPLSRKNDDGGRHGPNHKKRQWQGQHKGKKQKAKVKSIVEGSTEEVLLEDVTALLASARIAEYPAFKQQEKKEVVEETGEAVAGTKDASSLPEPFTEIEVEVLEISSTGDGLAVHPSSNQIYVVPFTTPGDIVKAKVIRHLTKERYSMADFMSVVKAGPLRADSRIGCKYFGTCSGCQFQMMEYSEQLKHKKRIVEKAYKKFSDLPPELIPVIQDTMGSPLQYGYRTKLTPHFDGPPGYLSKADKRNGERKYFTEVPPIGFMVKGTRRTLDIEDCPIGTDAVRMGMKRERVKVAEQLETYKKGVTILLRESTLRVPKDDERASTEIPETIKTETDNHVDFKSCITDNNGTSTEYIDDFTFTNIAGSFFQNNNSILPNFTQYIRDNILPPPGPDGQKIKYLIDAYSGSGLFTITLSQLFTQSTGIDISVASITSARHNANLNNLPPARCTFIAADAAQLFKSVTYPKDETVVVIDPPRKGCDSVFLSQLLTFAPKRIVYVSCNVHTQARDVGVMVRGMGHTKTRYRIESLRGWDFFPQTSHVEGVAVLSLVEPTEVESAKSVTSTTEPSRIEEVGEVAEARP